MHSIASGIYVVLQIRAMIVLKKSFVGRLGLGCMISRQFDSGKVTRVFTNESTKTIKCKIRPDITQ